MQPNFALFFAGDAYSTERKIMGRQSAGKSFLRGLSQAAGEHTVHALGMSAAGGTALHRQMRASGFQGQIRWSVLPHLGAAAECGALYFPGPPTRELAACRNQGDPRAFSLMGLTHTVASKGATDEIAALVLPPFQPWDALICTSRAAQQFVQSLHEDMRRYWHEHTGASRFNPIMTSVIPLGINTADFAVDRGVEDAAAAAPTATQGAAVAARQALGLCDADVVFLFAGRLSFHAKANPAPVYQALQAVAARQGAGGLRVVCIEAGVFPNEAIQDSYRMAQRRLAPDVVFLGVDGQDAAAYRQAWEAADVFLSLSDNIQETFGLTPVEAMAAGLPVVVSDWNGYKDTVRHGVDGFRIPTCAAPPGAGVDLAIAHALEADNYDHYIGRTSLATVVHGQALFEALQALTSDRALRRRMGHAGARRARHDFDWQVVLPQYRALATELKTRRQGQAPAGESEDAWMTGVDERGHAAAPDEPPRAPTWPVREDPFRRFAHFPTHTLNGSWTVKLPADGRARLVTLLDLHMCRYGLHETLLPPGHLDRLVERLDTRGPQTVQTLLHACGLQTPSGVRALMWLWKFGVVQVGSAG